MYNLRWDLNREKHRINRKCEYKDALIWNKTFFSVWGPVLWNSPSRRNKCYFLASYFHATKTNAILVPRGHGEDVNAQHPRQVARVFQHAVAALRRQGRVPRFQTPVARRHPTLCGGKRDVGRRHSALCTASSHPVWRETGRVQSKWPITMRKNASA